MPICPHCQAEYISGALYCDYCGRRLPPPASPPLKNIKPWLVTPEVKPWPVTPEDRQESEQTPPAPDMGEPDKPPHLRLQLLSGIVIDLGSRENIVIGRKDSGQEPDVDLAPYGGVEQGVGRRHAIITLNEGRYYIEDLNSINFTLLNSGRLFPGQRYPLRNGDQLQLGAMIVKVLL
jgi:pSer/pThr/pTyr-binding forkhead associated (FHA) protein